MRTALILAVMLLTGCDHGFLTHIEKIPEDQLPARAELILIGVVEGHHLDSFPYFRPDKIPDGSSPEFWRPWRRRVLVEAVLRGNYTKPQIDVYEIFWFGGGSFSAGEVDFTRDGQRYLFLLRQEGGRWRVVQDYYRSIFPVSSAGHTGLPLYDSRLFWERFALMNFWIDRSTVQLPPRPDVAYMFDPAQALGLWRRVKLLRGLLRHPSHEVRREVCKELGFETGWEMTLNSSGCEVVARDAWPAADTRRKFAEALRNVASQTADEESKSWSMDWLRVFTTVGDLSLRRELCRTFKAVFPSDIDNGCAQSDPFPATIIRQEGEVPLVGDWPRNEKARVP